MRDSAFDGLDEKSFFDRVQAKFVEKAPDLSQSLNINDIRGGGKMRDSAFDGLDEKSFFDRV
ncbi:GTP-binding protein, partial [Microcoleus sp. F10-C6]